MLTRPRLAVCLAAFLFTFPAHWVIAEYWQPLRVAQRVLRLSDPPVGCHSFTPEWIEWTTALTVLGLPLLGALLSLLSLLASLRRGHRPAVAPALAAVAAASAQVA